MPKYRYLAGLPFCLMVCMTDASEISLTGKVIANPCIVDTNTRSKQVELPKGQIRRLATAGTGGEWVDFQLQLNECPAYLTQATVNFSGTPDNNDSKAFKNNGTSKNIALQLKAQDTLYGNGMSLRSPIDAKTHKAYFPLSARMYTPTGGASSGTFNSVVNLTFTYQ